MVLFDMLGMVSYYCAVTLSPRRAVFSDIPPNAPFLGRLPKVDLIIFLPSFLQNAWPSEDRSADLV